MESLSYSQIVQYIIDARSLVVQTLVPRDMASVRDWSNKPLSGVSLDAAGLIALTDLATISQRTALTGSSCYADCLVVCPGIHRQSDAVNLNNGEYPITANIDSGYVFRVENQGTVHYLQQAGKTGHLVTLRVREDKSAMASFRWLIDLSGSWQSVLLYLAPMCLTIISLVFLIIMQDWWGMGILLALMTARVGELTSVRRRCAAPGWAGASEPDKYNTLLILLSQDRWIRMQGAVDDLKAVTSGQWMRDKQHKEDFLESISTVLVYACAGLGSNASQVGKVLLVLLLLVNAALLAISNNFRNSLFMKGYIIEPLSKAKPYNRRLDMAKELISVSGRDDWAVKMGLILESTKSRGRDGEASASASEKDSTAKPSSKVSMVDV